MSLTAPCLVIERKRLQLVGLRRDGDITVVTVHKTVTSEGFGQGRAAQHKPAVGVELNTSLSWSRHHTIKRPTTRVAAQELEKA